MGLLYFTKDAPAGCFKVNLRPGIPPQLLNKPILQVCTFADSRRMHVWRPCFFASAAILTLSAGGPNCREAVLQVPS